MPKQVVTPEDKQRWNLWTRYRLTPEQVVAMLEAQDYLCKICEKVLRPTGYKVDHCHTTGKVRGLLYHRCNLLLSGVEDAEFHLKAMAYLGESCSE